MVTQVLIAKDIAYGDNRDTPGTPITGVNELDKLAAGALALLGDVGGAQMALIDAAADFADVKSFYIAVGGNAGEGATLSKRIERSSIGFQEYYSFNEYAAPVAEIMYLGDNDTDVSDLGLPTSFIPGDTLEVTIQDTSNNFIPSKSIERYTYAIKLTDTEESAINGIVAAINKGSLMTALAIGAATANAGIKLTGKTAGARYKVSLGGLMVDAPIFTAFNAAGNALASNKPVGPSAGNGTYAQVKQEAEYASTIAGNTSRNELAADMFTYLPALTPVVGVDYSTYTFNYSTSGFYPSSTRGGVPQTLKLFVPKAGTSAAAATLISVLSPLFLEGVSEATQATETGAAEEAENV